MSSRKTITNVLACGMDIICIGIYLWGYSKVNYKQESGIYKYVSDTLLIFDSSRMYLFLLTSMIMAAGSIIYIIKNVKILYFKSRDLSKRDKN